MTKKIGIVVATVVTAMLVYGLFVAFTPTNAHAGFTPCVWPNTCS